MRIDAHQHFWRYDPVEYDWIGAGMEMIQRDFLPGELKGLLQENNIDGCITVQSEQNEKHNAFLSDLAEQFDYIKAIIGWTDLEAEGIGEKLDELKIFPKLKGFRHILQGEPKRDMMLGKAFLNGLQELGKRGYSYDILVYPDQLPYVFEMLKLCPDQPFILDHLGKPRIKEGLIQEWEKNIGELASFENLYCKLSGLVTEADWKNREDKDLVPYLDVAVNAFGTDRLLFGSDWPVCLVASSYNEVTDIIKGYFSSFTETEKQKVFGLNAVKFYNLK